MSNAVTAVLPATPASSVTTARALATSSYWGTVGGQRIISGALSIPLYGAWQADLVLATDQALPTLVTVQIGNLSLVGAVYRQVTFGGRTEARIVGGAGGWNKTVEARGYSNPAGIPAFQVLTDAALEVGESVSITGGGVLGNFYERLNDKASRVLRAVAGEQWWIDASGVTHVGTRTGSAISSDFQVIAFAGASGLATIATEDPASWQPSATFSSPTIAQQTIASVRHVFGNHGVSRLEVMTSATNDRWIENVRELVRDELASSVAYARIWEYSVVNTDGKTIDALPVDPGAPVPPVTGVPIRNGIPGLTSVVVPGTHVAVGFLNAHPWQPVCVGAYDQHTPLSSLLQVSATLQLGDETAQPLPTMAWLLEIYSALNTLAAQLATVATIPQVAAAGSALVSNLVAASPTTTTKVMAT